jgi:phasin family protein
MGTPMSDTSRPNVKARSKKVATAIFANHGAEAPSPFRHDSEMASVASATDPAAVDALIASVSIPELPVEPAPVAVEPVEIAPVESIATEPAEALEIEPVSVAEALPVAEAPIPEAPASPEIVLTPAPALAAAEPLIERADAAIDQASDRVQTVFSKGLKTMATAFDTTAAANTAANTATAFIGDLNGRAKGAMEKSVKIAETMTEFHKGNLEAMVASGRVATQGMQSMAQDAAEAARTNFEQATTAFKSFASVKSPTELFQLQSEYARSTFDQLIAAASKTSEQMLKLAGEVAQPLSSRYAVASEQVKTASI